MGCGWRWCASWCCAEQRWDCVCRGSSGVLRPASRNRWLREESGANGWSCILKLNRLNPPASPVSKSRPGAPSPVADSESPLSYALYNTVFAFGDGGGAVSGAGCAGDCFSRPLERRQIEPVECACGREGGQSLVHAGTDPCDQFFCAP